MWRIKETWKDYSYDDCPRRMEVETLVPHEVVRVDMDMRFSQKFIKHMPTSLNFLTHLLKGFKEKSLYWHVQSMN